MTKLSEIGKQWMASAARFGIEDMKKASDALGIPYMTFYSNCKGRSKPSKETLRKFEDGLRRLESLREAGNGS